jgi:hypothetical protein
LTCANILADLRDDDGDDTVDRRAQGHLLKSALRHRECGGRGPAPARRSSIGAGSNTGVIAAAWKPLLQ